MATRTRNLPNETRRLPTASFALRPTQIEQIRKIAAERRVSQSTVVRDAVDRYFELLAKEAAVALQQSRHRLPEAPTPQPPAHADESPSGETRSPDDGPKHPS